MRRRKVSSSRKSITSCARDGALHRAPTRPQPSPYSVRRQHGAPREVVATALLDDSAGDWEVALAFPGIEAANPQRPVVVGDGEGLVCIDRGAVDDA